jgi:hypothetical protein
MNVVIICHKSVKFQGRVCNCSMSLTGTKCSKVMISVLAFEVLTAALIIKIF